MSAFKQYIGDSVYADYDGRVILTTENGYSDDPRNRIVLEPEVVQAFLKWLSELQNDSTRFQAR